MKGTAPYRVLVVDWPWRFRDKLPGPKRGADKHYRTLDIGVACDFPRPPLERDALLFFWRVGAMVEEAYTIVRAWGFVPKAEIVWLKTTTTGKPHFGMGHYVRYAHETCIIATRGRAKVRDRSIRSTFTAPAGRHSEKPEEFYRIVERLSVGPYAELFARRRRPGWACFGDELEVAA